MHLAISQDRGIESGNVRAWNRGVCGIRENIFLPPDLTAITVKPELIADLRQIQVFGADITEPFPQNLVEAAYLPKILFNPDYRQSILAAFNGTTTLVVPNRDEWRFVCQKHPQWMPPFATRVDLLASEDDDDAVEKLLGSISPVAIYTDLFIKSLFLKVCDKFLNLKIRGYNSIT